MRTHLKDNMAVNFYLDKRADKHGDCPIRVSISIFGARFISSTGYKVAPAKWDQSKQQVKKGSTAGAGVTYSTINAALAKLSEHFSAYEHQCMLDKIKPTSAEIKKELAEHFARKKTTGGKQALIFDYFELYYSEVPKQNQWSLSTCKSFRKMVNYIDEFDHDLTFGRLTEKRLNDFVLFLREDKNLRDSTVKLIVGILFWVLRWATKKGYNTNLDYQKFSLKTKTPQNPIVFLEWEELMKIYHYEFPPKGTRVLLKEYNGRTYEKKIGNTTFLQFVRDFFCFCCFTSLRFSDMQNLKWSSVSENTITITTIKTSSTITIELNKYSLEIIDRYRGMDNEYVFPRITNSKGNELIHVLCELCEINAPITKTYYKGGERIEDTRPKFAFVGTHTGRRTFICNALMMGIPANIVMKWTGHSDYSAMKPYIDIANSAKAEAMALFDKR